MIRKILKAGQYIYPSNSISGLVGQVKFAKQALFHRKLLQSFICEIDAMGYSAIFNQDIPVLGALEWPYIHKEWTVEQRFSAILGHYQQLKMQPEFLNVSDGNPKKIVDLNEYSVGTALVLDKAKWFVREGEIVLNLFKDELRMMSLAFTFARVDKEFVIYIGAIQGIHADDQSLASFKTMTKDFEGVRPRDLLIEVLRMIARKVGAKRILGINDDDRHHHHAYFCNFHDNKLKSSYNAMWLEQNAEAYCNAGFYGLPLNKDRRDIAEVSSNKRAMYRRRYEMLDEIDATIDMLMISPYRATDKENVLNYASAEYQMNDQEHASI